MGSTERRGKNGLYVGQSWYVAAECVSVERPTDQKHVCSKKKLQFFKRIIGTGQLFRGISICLKL